MDDDDYHEPPPPAFPPLRRIAHLAGLRTGPCWSERGLIFSIDAVTLARCLWTDGRALPADIEWAEGILDRLGSIIRAQ